jgi:hypothetical protein
MNTAQENTHRPEPYTPAPDGCERRWRAWVHLPADQVTTPDAGEANAPPNEHDSRD